MEGRIGKESDMEGGRHIERERERENEKGLEGI